MRDFPRNLSRPQLPTSPPRLPPHFAGCHRRQLVLQIFLHDRRPIGWMVVPPCRARMLERLQQNLAISVPTLSQIALEAAFDGRPELQEVRHGYEAQNGASCSNDILPRRRARHVSAPYCAFYLYALDASRFSNELEEAGVAAMGVSTSTWCTARTSCACAAPGPSSGSVISGCARALFERGGR